MTFEINAIESFVSKQHNTAFSQTNIEVYFVMFVP